MLEAACRCSAVARKQFRQRVGALGACLLLSGVLFCLLFDSAYLFCAVFIFRPLIIIIIGPFGLTPLSTTIEHAHYRCSSKLSRRVMAHKRDKHKYQQSIKTREKENDTFPTRYCTIKQATKASRKRKEGKRNRQAHTNGHETNKHTQTKRTETNKGAQTKANS